jgi:hypothetical protein
MPPRTPLLLVDNLFDTVTQYTAGVLTATSERTGHEGFRVADYRRERSWWQTATTTDHHSLVVDLSVGVARAVDFLFIDRGHNLWGKTIGVIYSNDGASYTGYQFLSVPALGTLGGDPTSATMCVTEEGALYSVFALSAAHRWWGINVAESWAPVVPGLMLGQRTQLEGYSRVFDEDAGERTEEFATSKMGVRGYDTTYAWRTLKLDLTYIGPADYDATTRMLREKIWRRNSPFVCLMDWGTRPERGWMYQYDGRAWGFPKSRVYRAGVIQAREVGASVP